MLLLPLRRSHPRHSVQKIVSYQHEDRSVLTLTLDLGLGGMKIKTQDPLPRGQCLDFKLVLGAGSISPVGRIAYSRVLPNQQVVSGIHVIELSKEDHALLGNYLATLEGWPRPRGMLSVGKREDDQAGSRKTS